MHTSRTPRLSLARRLAAAALGLVVTLTGAGLVASPAGAAPPGATHIIGATAYDVAGPSSHHRVTFAPQDVEDPITAFQVERWNAAGTKKLTVYNESGSDLDLALTVNGMPDGQLFQYRARVKTEAGWGTYGGFAPILTTVGVGHHRPFATEQALVERQLGTFLGPDTGNSAGFWTTQIDDAADVGVFIDQLQTSPVRANRPKVIRLYFAFFDRAPDFPEVDYWQDRLDTGASSLTHVANAFAASAEFKATYGGLSNQQFVTLVYLNVLSRNPAPNEVAYWKGQLDQGLTTRGKVMIGFSESAEGTALRHGEVIVADMWATMMRDPAPSNQLNLLGSFIDDGGTAGSLGLLLLARPDYPLYLAD